MALTKVSGDFIQSGSITQGHLHTNHGITTTHIAEGDKLFFTNARVDARVQASLSTSDLSEGTNLYYTDARVASYLTTNSYATQSYVNTQVSNLVDSAPSTLDTLNELAAALGDDANFSTTVTNSIATKMPLAGGTFTGNVTVSGSNTLELFGYLYTRSTLRVLNAAGTGWHNWATRGGGKYDLNVNNITVAAITASGNVTGANLNISNWDTAYGWGNHASAGYLTSYTETDTLQTVTNRGATTTNAITLSGNSNGLYFTGGNNRIYFSGYRAMEGSTTGSNLQIGEGYSLITIQDLLYVDEDIRSKGQIRATGWYNNPSSSITGHAVEIGVSPPTGTEGYILSYNRDNSTYGDLNFDAINYHFNNRSSGTFEVEGSVRTPIFYDSDNTGRYINPASSSRINRLEIENTSNQDTPTAYMQIGSDGFIFGGNNSGYETNSAQISAGYHTANSLNFVGMGTTSSNRRVDMWAEGGFYVSGVIYDKDSTGYYLDPHSTSRTNTIISNVFSGDISTSGDGQNNYPFRLRYDYNAWMMTVASNTWGLFWAGNSGARYGTNGNGGPGNIWSNSTNPNEFAFVGGDTTLWTVHGTSGNSWQAGYGTAAGSYRAPIFYDSDNTNYYLNPTSTSNLSKAIFNTSSTGLPRQITIKEDGDTENSMGSYPGAWTSALNIQSNDGSTYLWFSPLTSNIPRIQTNYGQIDFYTGNNTNRALHLSGTSARSEVFYDLNNTGYYVNPASDSVFGGDLAFEGGAIGSIADGASTANQVSRIVFPQGGAGSWDSSQTGAIKIRLPIRANNNMWSMKVRIYNYNTNQSEEYFLGNYSYSNGGYNSQVAFHGGESSTPKNVRFGNDGTYDCVWIGETNSSWNYPVVSVLDFQAGFRSASIANNIDNYDVSIVTSFGTVQTTISPNTKAGNIVYAHGSFRAPAFYQSDDTNQYWDGNRLIMRGSDPTIIMRDTNHNSAMIHVNSNIFYVLRGGNDTSSWGTVNGYWPLEINLTNNQATFGGVVQAITDMRAPIFYDLNDTAYYIDPNSSSRSGLFRSYLTFNDYGAGVVGSYSASRYQLVFAMGESYKGALNGTSVSGGYGLWYSHPNAGGVAANLNNHGLMNIVNGTWHASLASSTRAATDMRAPIFYDLNDTNYYANPASTSDLKLLRTGKNHAVNAVRWDTSFYVAQSQHFYAHSSTQTMYLGESNHINIRNIADIHGDARAPIYYDRANTGYYTRPASSSNMYSIYAASFVQVGASGYSNLWLGGQSGNYFRFHTNNSHTYFDGNVGDIHWRQGSSTRFIFYMTTANMTVNGTVTQNSDERIKENIITIDSALNKVNQLRGVYYNRTDINTSQKQIGLIAQEVENVIPEVVLTANDELNTKSISYGQINALLIEAIKEQQTIIDDLKSRIEILENQ